jgi:hypothetical protein
MGWTEISLDWNENLCSDSWPSPSSSESPADIIRPVSQSISQHLDGAWMAAEYKGGDVSRE